MSIPAIIVYIVLAGFALGILLPLALVSRLQRARPGAMLGLLAGSVLSIPAGLLSGMFVWSGLEEGTALSREVVIFAGPLIGCFFGTVVVAFATSEVGASIAAARIRRTEQASN